MGLLDKFEHERMKTWLLGNPSMSIWKASTR